MGAKQEQCVFILIGREREGDMRIMYPEIYSPIAKWLENRGSRMYRRVESRINQEGRLKSMQITKHA